MCMIGPAIIKNKSKRWNDEEKYKNLPMKVVNGKLCIWRCIQKKCRLFLSSRPCLSSLNQAWLGLHLLKCVQRSHSHNTHTSIISNNLCVGKGLWIVLVDIIYFWEAVDLRLQSETFQHVVQYKQTWVRSTHGPHSWWELRLRLLTSRHLSCQSCPHSD